MSDTAASRLLSESYDRKLTLEETQILNNAMVAEPALAELKHLLDRVRVVHQQDNSEFEIVSSQNGTAPKLSDELKQKFESQIQDALQKKPQQESVFHAPTRQIKEVAFASVAIEQGKLTHGQLAAVAESWSAYGNVPLSDHMVSQQVITREEADELETVADETIMELGGDETKIIPSATNVFETMTSVAGVLGVPLEASDAMAETKLTIGGEYSLIRKIGGGLGSVWLANDNNLDRTVAIKTIARSGDGSDSMIRRFAREAIITGKLDHPNIVTIYQYGEDAETGDLFYAMRFLGKRTLQEAIQEYHQHKVDGISIQCEFHKLLSAFMTVCQAIGFAHAKGVIHRDIKPQNIALDDFGQVTVLDWGLAKVLHDDELFGGNAFPENENLTPEKTLQGDVLGTPWYMSPEQAAGHIDQIDTRTDVYGLGGVLFEILTGKPPHFQCEIDLKSEGRIESMLSEIVQRDTPRVTDVVADVDDGLAKICDRAISKMKHSRHSSAIELCEAVQEWISGVANRIKIQETLKSAVCDLNTRFTNLVDDTKCNLRFLAVLPPVQGIIDAVGERDGAEGVEVWIDRFSVVLESLIRTNSQILSASFFRVGEDNGASEICAVSRHINDSSFVKKVPHSRLIQLAESAILDGVQEAGPDDVLFTFSNHSRNKKIHVGMVLRGDLPIFDDGELFGFLSITVEPSLALSDDHAERDLDAMVTSVFDCSLGQIAGTAAKIRKESLAHVKQLVETNDCTELESVGFYGRKIEFEDIPGRALTAVVCASTRSNDS